MNNPILGQASLAALRVLSVLREGGTLTWIPKTYDSAKLFPADGKMRWVRHRVMRELIDGEWIVGEEKKTSDGVGYGVWTYRPRSLSLPPPPHPVAAGQGGGHA